MQVKVPIADGCHISCCTYLLVFYGAMQAMGIALLSLKGSEFMDQPRKVCQVNMPMYKPEAHGQLLKLAKVSRHEVCAHC